MRISIADNGEGIPPSDRKRLFQPFFTTRKVIGTGLGLWTCKNIVDRHAGHIQFRSSPNAEHSWTVFSVVVPLEMKVLPAVVP